MQTANTDKGRLQINVQSAIDSRPIADAHISISYTSEPEQVIEQLTTNSSGQTEEIELGAPPVELSLNVANEIMPYSEYTLRITAPGFEEKDITGAQILADVEAIQNARLNPLVAPNEAAEVFTIPYHTLYGVYPPKIAEEEIKPTEESGEIVLSRVVIPEFIIVHDGSPRDPTARMHYTRYRDYIKNVASNEVYATWPTNTLRANILAIMSFTLNRVYTEWYRNRGFDFMITSSTAFDQKWVPERNIFDTISVVVDELFGNYLSRPNVRQPILTQYCDGNRVSCPNWMSQWGSKALGDQGYSAIEILRYYYGQNMYINTAPEVSGIPRSWPGHSLEIGFSGENVRIIQEQLNAIAQNYPAIPKLVVDGVYGPLTKASVEKFQSVFNLPVTGVVDYATWYRISEIYVAVTRIAELV